MRKAQNKIRFHLHFFTNFNTFQNYILQFCHFLVSAKQSILNFSWKSVCFRFPEFLQYALLLFLNSDVAYSNIYYRAFIYAFCSAFLLLSINLCKIAAISALVASSFGFSSVSVLPVINSEPTAYCIASAAYSETLPKSV